ncbi:MAG: sialidase family protein [Gaiellaceae bacterium]
MRLARASIPVLLLIAVVSTASASAAHATSPVRVSRCSAPEGNVEPIQAVQGRYVYEAWIGCGGFTIGFARSTDGGRKFARAQQIPSPDPSGGEWDPAVAVAPDGTVYVSYMAHVSTNACANPVPAVAVSVDHGETFSRVSALTLPKDQNCNWGDRDFIAVGPDGTVYVTWDYGPPGDKVKTRSGQGGSDYYTAGEFNAVVQKSSDGGRTWTQPVSINPDFPLGGVFSAPIVAEPDGALDVLYWQHPTNPSTLALSPGHEYFTRSVDGGATWSTPVAVDPGAGTISLPVWWIDGSLAVDHAGNLYAAWDTQHGRRDTAWLAWSSDGGRHWSKRLRVTSSKRVGTNKNENLVEVAAAGRRQVYVGWQTTAGGWYATYVRRLLIGHGWTSRAVRISDGVGDSQAWPGDTIGISIEPSGAAVLSWGEANGQVPRGLPAIYAASVKLPR